MKAILDAIDNVCQRYQIRIIETAGRFLYSGMLLEELNKGKELGLSMKTEIHADVRETSYIACSHPHLLKKPHTELPAVLIDVIKGLAQGHTTFKAMGATQGYIGSPAMASPALGKIHVEEQARITAGLITHLIAGQPLPEMSPGMLKYLKEHVQL
jgi:creatinine amidohydrolase